MSEQVLQLVIPERLKKRDKKENMLKLQRKKKIIDKEGSRGEEASLSSIKGSYCWKKLNKRRRK